MNLKICDICKLRDGKITESCYRLSYKNGVKRLALDSCNDHKGFFKDCKTFANAEQEINKLYGIVK